MSLKKNILYSLILTASTYLFPLFVYPYVSRTLGLSNIGIVNFVDNLINYFVLISMMGITVVGVREIAAVRNDKERLSKVFSSLFFLTIIATFLATTAFLIAMYSIPTLIPYRDLLYIGLIKLVFNLLLVEWFFTGIEDFKYITNRSLVVKFLYVFCVFAFVHQPSDYKVYYVISVAMVVVNALINTIYCRKHVKFSLKNIEIKPYVAVFFMMGVYILMTNIYTSINTVWLGFVTNTDEVGYYTTATKLHVIVMSVLAAFSNVVFPRVSNLLSEGKLKEYWAKIDIALDAIFLFSFPTVILLMVIGPDILHIIVGDGFEGAYTPLRIITPLILVIGIEQILVIQILMAMHSDKIVLANSVLGAAVSIMCNFIFTKELGAIGSAIVWVCAETTIMLFSIYFCKVKHSYTFPMKKFAFYILLYTPLMLLSLWLTNKFDSGYTTHAGVVALVGIYSICIEIFIFKNSVAIQLINKLHPWAYHNNDKEDK